jgi:hypothetical protein
MVPVGSMDWSRVHFASEGEVVGGGERQQSGQEIAFRTGQLEEPVRGRIESAAMLRRGAVRKPHTLVRRLVGLEASGRVKREKKIPHSLFVYFLVLSYDMGSVCG